MNKKTGAIILYTILFLIFVVSCKNETNSKNIIRSLQPTVNAPIKQGGKINFKFTTTSKIDSARLFIDDKYIASTENNGFVYSTDINKKTGETPYKVEVYRKGKVSERNGRFLILPKDEPKRVDAKLINTLPHSRNSYTQGLEFFNENLYESSGEYGKSYVKIMEFPSMKTIKEITLESKYFAEGITILNDKLYLLTWKEQKAFVYDAHTLEKLSEFDYKGEGWGLTNDGKYLYMSDGTKYIYKVDPNTFRKIEKIEVLTPNGAILDINELEWINGKIYANVYGYDSVLVINPTTGIVEKIIFCNNLLKNSKKDAETDVFNGIAFDKANNKLYVTGKNWPEIFEIKY